MDASLNWIFENPTVTEKDIKALEKAKTKEKKNDKSGYRWIRVSPTTKIHVPCDENGEPTVEGVRRINILKNAKGAYL